MIPAKYDDKGNILLDLTLIGRCGQKKVTAILDTGFSGSLAIPTTIGCEVGLTHVGNGRVVIASGQVVKVPIFVGKLGVGTEVIDCIYIILAGSEEILVGMGVLKDFNVNFHGAKRAITVLKGEEQLSKVEEAKTEEAEIEEAITPVVREVKEITPVIKEAIIEIEEAEKPSRMNFFKQKLRELVPR